ncbi:large conductance mechanosensitive channel protein MscL [Winogradskyella jejuensis]|uniref:Large-conductance mechanosensitive channel n=1 Tax=Winogradskyella jejuensis TaxID=1089305 RepID=A0A1M5V0I4_9FLAO|nr:large conductance mechanosensitive channel protein MscL [Winogradskyella jejuensis]SHH68598.1 large conductance mechanosensitive channel [Winogradskyella jejuensis]
MKLLKEFKEFAVKGNMMDMAIGIIIGAAFNKVIDVLAKQVLLPPLSLLSDDVNLENQKLILREATSKVDEVSIAYGKLAEVFLDFLIIGFTVFVVVKAMNRLKRKAQDSKDTTVSTPKDIELLSHLTELMEEQNQILKTLKPSK